MMFPVLPPSWEEWVILKKLGEGSSGEVYEAARGNERCAIKIIYIPRDEAERAALMIETKEPSSAALFISEMADRAENEIKLQRALGEQPHIVKVEDYLVERAKDALSCRIYIRMELLVPFYECFPDEPVGEAEAVKLGLDLCEALTLLSRRRITHRDIKPGNIFGDNGGNFKLGDFGLAGRMGISSGLPSVRGTFSYMAPETYRKKIYSNQADLYSLGIVLYRLMNRGREPFVDPFRQLVGYKERAEALARRMHGEKLPPPADASPRLATVILNACAYDPKCRYPDAGAMKADLLRVSDPAAEIARIREEVSGESPSASGGSLESPSGRETFHRRALLFVGFCLAIGLLTFWGRHALFRHNPVEETQEPTKLVAPEETALPMGTLCHEEGQVALRERKRTWSFDMEEALVQADLLLARLSKATLQDLADFTDCFADASQEEIEAYFYDLRTFPAYPNRLLFPVAEASGVCLVNVLGYPNRQQQEENNAPWSQGWVLPLVKQGEEWKISLDPEMLSRFSQELAAVGAYPAGYLPYRDSGFMVDYNNYMYLDAELAYEGIAAGQVRFLWQDEAGDLWVSIQFTNGTDGIYTFGDLTLQLVNLSVEGAAIVFEGRIGDEVKVLPGTNEILTWRFDGGAAALPYEEWNDIRPVLQALD